MGKTRAGGRRGRIVYMLKGGRRIGQTREEEKELAVRGIRVDLLGGRG